MALTCFDTLSLRAFQGRGRVHVVCWTKGVNSHVKPMMGEITPQRAWNSFMSRFLCKLLLYVRDRWSMMEINVVLRDMWSLISFNRDQTKNFHGFGSRMTRKVQPRQGKVEKTNACKWKYFYSIVWDKNINIRCTHEICKQTYSWGQVHFCHRPL